VALQEQATELKLKVETAERERDFYFEKLRDIEILCQAPELQEIPAIRIVEKILYAADSAEAKDAMAEAQRIYNATLEQPVEEEAVPAQ
jgi:RP/EB family microtubule-associated protein